MKSKKKRNIFELLQLVLPVSFPWIAIGIALSVASAGMAIYQGYQQQKIANANAKAREMHAQRQKLAAERKAALVAAKRKKERGTGRTGYAKGGVDVTEGSPLILEAEGDYLSEPDQAVLIAQGAEQAWASQAEAKIMRAQGRGAVTAGYGKAIGTVGASLLSVGGSGGSSPKSGSNAGANVNAKRMRIG